MFNHQRPKHQVPSFMCGRAPTHIHLSAHPALQIKKRTSKATFAQQRYPRPRTGGKDNVDREFRTSRRALNVLSVRAGLSEQATLSLAPIRGRRDHDSLTIGAKPFISFLVWPVFSNWTSIMSPTTEMTVPVPKVL